MTLAQPMIITSRLLPGVKIGKDTLSFDYCLITKSWKVILDKGEKPFKSYTQTGLNGTFSDIREVAENWIAFMTACAESVKYYGKDGENSDLFSGYFRQWIVKNQSALEYLQFELSDEALEDE